MSARCEGWMGSGGLFITTPRTFSKAADSLVRIAGKAEQGHSRHQYPEPSEAKYDPQYHSGYIDSLQHF